LNNFTKADASILMKSLAQLVSFFYSASRSEERSIPTGLIPTSDRLCASVANPPESVLLISAVILPRPQDQPTGVFFCANKHGRFNLL
jgi:hypothetical protein